MKTAHGCFVLALTTMLFSGAWAAPAAAMDGAKLPPNGPASKMKGPPDLDIVSTTVDPPSPRVGQQVKVTFTVKNIGGSAMGAAHFQIYGPYTPLTGPRTADLNDLLGTHTINGAAPAGSFEVPALAAGHFATIEISGVLDQKKMTIPTGTYEVLMDLNVSNNPPEGSQNNNFKGTQFEIRPGLVLRPPDLHAKELPLIPPRPISRVRPARPQSSPLH